MDLDRQKVTKLLDWHLRLEKRRLSRKIKHLSRMKAKSSPVQKKQNSRLLKCERSRETLSSAEVPLLTARCLELLADEHTLNWLANPGILSPDEEREAIQKNSENDNFVALALLLALHDLRKKLVSLCDKVYKGSGSKSRLSTKKKSKKKTDVNQIVSAITVERCLEDAGEKEDRRCLESDDAILKKNNVIINDSFFSSETVSADRSSADSSSSNINKKENSRQKKEKAKPTLHKDKGASHSEKSKSKNRPGQRTRQKMWVEQYGKKADAFKKGQVKRKDIGAIAIKKQHSRDTPGAFTFNERLQKKSDGKSAEGHTSTTDVVHPSWQAKRRQSNAMITTFKGNKITFDD